VIIYAKCHKDELSRYITLDAIGRMGRVVEYDGETITIGFDNGVLLDDGSKAEVLTIPAQHDKYGIETVDIITHGHNKGPHDGSVMLNVERLYKSFWGKFRKNDTRRKHNGHLQQVTDSIATDGLRHPIIVNKNLDLRVGAYRLAAYHQLGLEEIPAYITDTDAKRQWKY
jgi:hypothetical protein